MVQWLKILKKKIPQLETQNFKNSKNISFVRTIEEKNQEKFGIIQKGLEGRVVFRNVQVPRLEIEEIIKL